MSFKSKQRAKHGHLFGDGTKDPLNAALVSTSDDPLFASSTTKTSQSSRTNSPVLDPLSRTASPLDVSNSTPISPRRPATTNTSSIFGDVDVSKLGNGKRHGLRSSRFDEQDEEDLFGGRRIRVSSKASSPTPSATSSVNKKTSPIVNHDTLPQQTIPTPRKATPPPPPPPQVTLVASTLISEAEKIEEKPVTSSFFASASRFFKSSSSSTNSKTSSSASSIASVNNTNPAKEEEQEVQQQQQQEKEKVATPVSPIRQHPPVPSKQQEQRQIPSIIDIRQQIDQQEEEEEEEEEEELSQPTTIIEDEATRAFADDVISFQPTKRPTYISLTPDLLTSIDLFPNETPKQQQQQRLLPSVSTPTATTADVDDPWFDSTLNTSTIINKITPMLLEPSISSPVQPQHHRVLERDIEPEKRSAFADLISSWNNNNTVKKEQQDEEEEEKLFFNHVAEEQRDIGFAGISATVQDDDNNDETTITRSVVTSDVWDNQEENPWN